LQSVEVIVAVKECDATKV